MVRIFQGSKKGRKFTKVVGKGFAGGMIHGRKKKKRSA